uniref:BTB domain-containing protein n=1 Tax=Panagrolaimus superbus TaxID=310955 RepID=A0A914Y578_9BILA
MDCSATVNRGPTLILGSVEDENGTTEFLGKRKNKNEDIILEPDTEVKVSLTGYRFDGIEAVGFTTYSHCDKVLYISKKDFVSHNENLVVIKYTFEPTTFSYKICIKQTPLKSYNDKSKGSLNAQDNSSELYKIMSNQKYYDVILISSDEIEIPSHCCILAKYSKIFEKIIDESSESPVKINVENYNAEIIEAALNFLYDKSDAIDGKEIEIFRFAIEYDIDDILNSWCSFFEKFVDPSNVCDYIQIAYSNNFEELKKKCLKFLIEKKKEIDSSNVADLPKNILSDLLTAL